MPRRRSRPVKRQPEPKIRNPKWSLHKKIFLYGLGIFMLVYAILGLLGAWIKSFFHWFGH